MEKSRRSSVSLFGSRLLAPFTARPPKKGASTCDHLDRALDSVLLNIPEGAGRERRSKDRRRFYRIALGSAKEAASAANILKARRLLPAELGEKARGLLLEVVSMLTAMTGGVP